MQIGKKIKINQLLILVLIAILILVHTFIIMFFKSNVICKLDTLIQANQDLTNTICNFKVIYNIYKFNNLTD